MIIKFNEVYHIYTVSSYHPTNCLLFTNEKNNFGLRKLGRCDNRRLKLTLCVCYAVKSRLTL